jgi:hypothetical protein
MLPASIRSQPRFRSQEEPEKRIFRNRKEAAAATMYPFTKVTWGHDDYERLEPAIRIVEPYLTAFLTTLCSETTFKFHQAYEAELNHKLAELKVEARQKKLVSFSAATETNKALSGTKKSANESVKVTIDKLQSQIAQLQRTQQRQSEKLKTANALTPNNKNPKPLQKNLPGSRGKGPSAEPKASSREKGSDKPPTPPNNRRPPNNNNKRKTPSNDTHLSAEDSANLKKRQKRQKQKQYKRKQLLEKQRQLKLKTNADKPVAVQPQDADKTPPEES